FLLIPGSRFGTILALATVRPAPEERRCPVIRFTLGDLRFTVLDAGPLWLDGGAMFGVVPKVLWERERPPDGRNRIRLAMNVLLVEDGKRRILVDTGAGNKLDEKQQRIYGIDPKDPDALLAPAGVPASGI